MKLAVAARPAGLLLLVLFEVASLECHPQDGYKEMRNAEDGLEERGGERPLAPQDLAQQVPSVRQRGCRKLCLVTKYGSLRSLEC